MAITQLNPDTFTAIAVASDGILQAKSGHAQIAGSASPAELDWIDVPNGGSMPVASGTVYGRGAGYVVTI